MNASKPYDYIFHEDDYQNIKEQPSVSFEEAKRACRAKMNEYCAKTLFGIRDSQEENMITLAKLMELL